MTTESIPQLTYSGNLVDMEQVGLLRRSDDAVGDRDELWWRMGEHGYLFLPGYLNRDEVVDVPDLARVAGNLGRGAYSANQRWH